MDSELAVLLARTSGVVGAVIAGLGFLFRRGGKVVLAIEFGDKRKDRRRKRG